MKKKKNISKALGKMKVWQTRLAGYISLVNFVMIFYLYIIESPMGFEWYHWAFLIVVGVTTIVFIDTKFIMPQAFGYTFSKNPGLQKLKKQSQENSEKLDLILNHLGLEYIHDKSKQR